MSSTKLDTSPAPRALGIDMNLEVVTLESPYLLADEDGWLEVRTALRWCVDLPA